MLASGRRFAFVNAWRSMDVAAPVGQGGLWLFLFSHQLRQMPLLPLGDPHLQEALAHDEE